MFSPSNRNEFAAGWGGVVPSPSSVPPTETGDLVIGQFDALAIRLSFAFYF